MGTELHVWQLESRGISQALRHRDRQEYAKSIRQQSRKVQAVTKGTGSHEKHCSQGRFILRVAKLADTLARHVQARTSALPKLRCDAV